MRRRLPVAAFVGLAIATIAAFFFTQHLKVTTPLIAGYPSPHPAAIDPRDGGVCVIPGAKGVPTPTSFRRMRVSFYLLNRADDVDVSIVDPAGAVIATLADSRHIGINHRTLFTWDGRRSNGQYAPDGTYYVQVSLIHQGRTVRISNQNSGALEPVRVQNGPAPIRVTGVRAGGIEPAVFPQPSGHPVIVHFTRTGRAPPTIRVYRTDLPGAPRLVNSYRARSYANAFWDGTLKSGRPAPQGTYLIGLSSLDHTCSRSVFPTALPPPPGSTPHAGVTVRYLAAQPSLTPVAPGSDATVEIDARRHRYQWALRRAGDRRVLSSGFSSAVALGVRLPGGSDGLYDLAVRWGSHRTVVPLVAGVSGSGGSPSDAAASGRVLVVLPALTWQGLNPVDDDGDGMPNTLALGQPIRLVRPLVDGLPAGLADEAGLLSYLRASGLRYSLTTDLSLLGGGEAALRRWSGIVFAGSERWLPASLGSALSTYVEQGGHVMSLGIDALRRSVTVSGDQALDPSGPHSVDDLLARPGPVRSTRGSLILVDQDKLHIFRGTAQALTGFKRYQQFGPVSSPAAIVSSAGVTSTSAAVIGYRLGRGDVVDIGLPGFGSSLAHNVNAGELVSRVWTLLGR